MALEIVTYIAQNLVNDLDSLEVTARREGRVVHIDIQCAEEDAGRIIGRGGRIINSLRTLVRASAEGRDRIEINLLNADSSYQQEADTPL